MDIETKFNVNDLVQYKYQRPNNKIICCFEVIEIKTQVCYTTAQVFYTCRSIHGHRDYDKGKHTIVDFGPGFSENREYVQFREDELKPCEETLKNLLLNSDIQNNGASQGTMPIEQNDDKQNNL